MKKIRTSLLIILTVLALFASFDTVKAFPPLPSSFYGTVKYNGENLPEGTVVQALIDGEIIAEAQTMMYQDESVYSIDVPGDDTSTTAVEGGTEGSEIQFVVGGLEVKETATWASGTNVEFNLSITSQLTPKAAEPTKTPIPTQTPIYITTDSGQEQSTSDPVEAATEQPSSDTEGPTIAENGQTETQAAGVAVGSNNQEDQTPISELNNQSSNVEESTPGSENDQDAPNIQFWSILIISVVLGVVLLIIFLLRKKAKNKHENLLF